MKRRGVAITLSITLFAVLFYGYRYLKIPVETKTAMLTQQEDVVSAKAYVIRTEDVYDAQVTGTMYNYVEEGDRVAKNMRISTVYQGDVDSDLVESLNNVDNRINKLEIAKEKSGQFITYSSSVDSTVEKVKADIISSVINHNIQEIESYKNSLKALNKEESEEFDSELYDLKRQKSEIESKLSSNKSDIYALMSGIFSLNVDGYEEVLTPETIMQYKVSDFEQINALEISQRTTNNVNFGESICKVVDNHVWYAMAVVSKKEAEQIKSKKEVIIRFDDLPGEEVSASVAYISAEAEENENVVLVLKSDRYLEGVYGMRSSNMEIVTNRHVGYEVPIHALRVVEEKTGVMVLGGTSEFFCEAKVVYTDEKTGIAIVYPAEGAKRKLSVGDRIVLGEKKD